MTLFARHVMVVDDNHDTLTVTKMMLECNGYQVHGFTDPAKALSHAHHCKECGIVITDYQMPIMNGLQLVKALKKLHPDIRVVLMTAFSKSILELPSSSVDQFLIKPFSMSKLVEAIEKCVLLVH